jgi:hypothetical protein
MQNLSYSDLRHLIVPHYHDYSSSQKLRSRSRTSVLLSSAEASLLVQDRRKACSSSWVRSSRVCLSGMIDAGNEKLYFGDDEGRRLATLPSVSQRSQWMS